MNKLNRSIIMLLLAMLLTTSIVSIANAYQQSPSSTLNNDIFQMGHPASAPQNFTEQDKVLRDNILTFLNNVAKLDTSKYNTDLFVDNRPGPNYDKILKFNFSSAESKVDVLCLIKDDSLFWCTISPVKGTPAFTTPKSSDILSNAKDALDELQAFSTKDYLPTMQSMLESVTEVKNSKTSTADFTQEIAVSGNTVRISWEPFANGLSNPQNKLTLEFDGGNLKFFADYLGMFTIGSSEAKISEQEAIQIAIEHAQAFSWVQDNVTVSNVTVLSDPVIANLTLQNRGNATLYPYWDIWLPLDKMYPGGVTAFHVSIWADTGEVAYITPIGSNSDPTTINQHSSGTTQQQLSSDYTLAIAITLITATAVSVGFLFFRRKR